MTDFSDADVFGAAPPAPVGVAPLPNVPGYVTDPGYKPPQGQAGNPTWQAPAVPLGGEGMSDADVFGATGQPGGSGQADTRPVSQSLGFAEGLNTVARNLGAPFMDSLPGTEGSPMAVVRNLGAAPMRMLMAKIQQGLGQQEQTYRPGELGRVGGELVGSAPLAIEGGPMLTGALQGYLSSDSPNLQGKLADAGLGAVGGKIGDKAFGAIKSVVAPTVRGVAQRAMDAGINLTPGAILGGGFQKAENVLSRTPVLGDMIRNSQNRALTDWRQATVDQALDPARSAGVNIPPITGDGHKIVDQAHSALSHAYETILPKLAIQPDATFGQHFSQAASDAANLEDRYTTRANRLLSRIRDGFSSGQMSGEEMKAVDSQLGRDARAPQGDIFASDYADWAGNLQGQLREMVTRTNPQYAPQLNAINTGYGKLIRIEQAAKTAAQREGEFTPNDLVSAARATDQSVRDNATGRGQALMQDWANWSKNVVPATTPKPGSPAEQLMELMVALGVGKEAGMPIVAKGAALGGTLGLAYTRPGQKVVTPLLTQRPQMAKDIANWAANFRPLAGYGGATALPKALPPGALGGLLSYLPQAQQ